MLLIIDSGKSIAEVRNSAKAIIIGDDGTERHVNMTDEGIIVDIVRKGKVIKTISITHEELLESA